MRKVRPGLAGLLVMLSSVEEMIDHDLGNTQ